jgi:tellurite resistance protein
MFGSAMGKIIIGIVLALIGLVAMIILDPETFGTLAALAPWAVLLLGAIFFAAGLVQMLTSSVAGDGRQAAPASGTERDYIVRTTLAIALADGRLDDSEVRTSAAIFKEVTGREIGTERVRELALGVKGGAEGLVKELKGASARISESTKLLIVKAAYLALAADGQVTAEEEQRIGDIAIALALPYEKVKIALAEADKQATVLRAGRKRD